MLIGRMDHGYAVRRDVPNLPQPPSAYMRRFTYDVIGHKASVVKFLISEVGAERVMLGSDYCLDMGYLRPVQDLEKLGLSTRDRDLILHATAARLLKSRPHPGLASECRQALVAALEARAAAPSP